MKVRDIMVDKVVALNVNDGALEAVSKLFNMQISGLPVTDEKGKLVGMFTEKGVIAKLLPSYLGAVGSFSYDDNPKAVKQKVSALAQLKVKDLMRSEVVTIGEDAAISEAARLMLTQKVRRVPVLDKEKNMVGIIARGDILKAIFKDYQKSE